MLIKYRKISFTDSYVFFCFPTQVFYVKISHLIDENRTQQHLKIFESGLYNIYRDNISILIVSLNSLKKVKTTFILYR